MDIILDYAVFKPLGSQYLLEMLQEIYSKNDLYCISTDWEKSQEFIAKAKGIHGDIIAGWCKNGQQPCRITPASVASTGHSPY